MFLRGYSSVNCRRIANTVEKYRTINTSIIIGVPGTRDYLFCVPAQGEKQIVNSFDYQHKLSNVCSNTRRVYHLTM